MKPSENSEEKTDSHILAGRAILLGEETINPQEWPLVKEHIQSCLDCKKMVARRVKVPFLREIQKALHPTEDQIEAYALPEFNTEFIFTAEEKEEIRSHLTICYSC